MKCDELKPIKQGSVELGEYWVYDAKEADEAIDELKAENQKLQTKIALCYDGKAFSDNEQLVRYLSAMKAVQDLEIRATERALWLARATIAHSTRYKYHRLYSKAEMDPQPHGWSCYINGEVYRTGKMNRMLEPHYWIELWEEVERKCLAKAKEYK